MQNNVVTHLVFFFYALLIFPLGSFFLRRTLQQIYEMFYDVTMKRDKQMGIKRVVISPPLE